MYSFTIESSEEMTRLGSRLGSLFKGGECLELIGDVGVGKTTLTKGLGIGLKIDEDVQSPSFTISRVYPARDDLFLHHYDFYRLSEPGVMSYELAESLEDPQAITVIEWAETVSDVLPGEHIRLHISYNASTEARLCKADVPEKYAYLMEAFV